MRRSVAIAIAIAGLGACSFSPRAALPDAEPEGDGGPEIDAPDTPGIDADPDDPDIDDDGVSNEEDNCPAVANAGQFDEDEDATGDECDRCPQLGDPAADLDDDGDGVGNGCDPRPDSAGDQLAYWNGFHVPGAGLPAPLAMVHGSSTRWSVADGHLVFTRSGDDWNIPAFDTGAQNHTTDAAFEIVTSYPVGVGSASAVGVAVDVAGNDDDVSECQVRTDNEQRELWYWDGRFFGSGWNALDRVSASTPNDGYRIVLHRTATGLACTTTRDGESVALASARSSAQRTRAGLFVRNVDARFRYLAIYTSP